MPLAKSFTKTDSPEGMPRPIMFVIAGPNGAGKTTFYKTHIAQLTAAPFINADDIQRNELTDKSVQASYEAAAIAEYRRDQLLAARQSFVTETVFSHPSKLELIEQAKAQDFDVRMFHVGVESPDLSVARVSERVKEGGHPVPENKIRERYDRNGPLIREAVRMADQGFVYDNSALNLPHQHLLSFESGKVVKLDPKLTRWAQSIYGEDINRFLGLDLKGAPDNGTDR